MRAAVAHRFGPPDVLAVEEVADPVAGVGQVVVDVEYASVTFVETQVRAGHPPDAAMTPSLPLIPGNGVGGIVGELGEGVDPHLLGRAVVTTTGGRGGYAERVAVDASQLIALPEGVSLADAVALLADGRTALALMQLASVRVGETVLIEAAAGGVGTCLVQLAKAAGARVVACAGSAEKLAAAEPLGADVLVDYSRKDWAEILRAGGEVVDVVFDGVGGDIGTEAFSLLRASGRFCQYGMASGGFTELPPNVRQREIVVLRGINLGPSEARDLSVQALERAAAAELRPVIGQMFSLEHAARAHAALEARETIGKTLLTPHGPPGADRGAGD
ncbi:MAG: zinc-binding dehydrogenase [Actinomycetota bacterium]|nr:zinc-binding dehydrogenase [Actinomycetota bacterium]